jgi:hypothetical protein
VAVAAASMDDEIFKKTLLLRLSKLYKRIQRLDVKLVEQLQFSAAKKRCTNLHFKSIGQINCGKIISTGLCFKHFLVFVSKEIHRKRLWETLNLQCQHHEKYEKKLEVQ